MEESASRVQLGEFGKRPSYFTFTARGEEVYGDCHEVMIGSQMSLIKHYAVLISV